MPRQRTAQDNPRDSAGQELKKNRRVNRAKLPMKCSANHCQYETKNQVSANHLGSGHLRIVQEEDGTKGTGSGGGESGFHTNEQREPGQPAGIFPSETWILGARSEEHTSELQSRQYLVCRLLLEKKKKDTA